MIAQYVQSTGVSATAWIRDISGKIRRLTAVYAHIHDDTNRKEQVAAIRDGLFVLTSLLLGFTLALAVPRYTERRTLLVEEALHRNDLSPR